MKVILSEIHGNFLTEKVMLSNKEFPEYAKIVAEAYKNAPINDPKAHSAYESLNSSNYQLWRRLLSKIQIEFVSENKSESGKILNISGDEYEIKYLPNQPYSTASEMIDDVKIHNTLKVNIDYSEHPFFSLEDNVVFRTVHDYIVHILGNKQFGLKGEIQAYNLHAKLVPVNARPAIFTEVVGQVCFHFIYNKFPTQKCVILEGFDYDQIGKIIQKQ